MAGTIEETMDDGTRSPASALTAHDLRRLQELPLRRPAPQRRARHAASTGSAPLHRAGKPRHGHRRPLLLLRHLRRALRAWGHDKIDVVPPPPLSTDAKPAPQHPHTRDWANDLIDRLATLQNEDGSFKSVDDRWMESDPVLITAYALIVLREAARTN